MDPNRRKKKSHCLAELTLFVLTCIYLNTSSGKCRAHLTDSEGTAFGVVTNEKNKFSVTEISLALFQRDISLD